MLETLGELLLTHHVAGHWRAPLSQRMRDVRGPDGRLLGRLVEAGPADLARVMAAAEAAAPRLAGLPAGARAALAVRFAAAVEDRAARVAEARRLEGGTLSVAAEGGVPEVVLPDGIVAVLGTVPASPAALARVMAEALRAGRPVILKPAPRAPLVALVLAEAMVAAGAPPGSLGLVQGGGAATGAGLLALRRLGGAVLVGKPAARPGFARAVLAVEG